MLELGGIRSARQSRARPVLPAAAALAAPAAPSTAPTQPPLRTVDSAPSRKRPLTAEDCGAANAAVTAPRVKLEAGRAEGSGSGSGSARAVVSRQGGSDGGREQCAASVRCGVAFVSIRALRQRTRQRAEEKRAEAEAERSGAAEAAEATEATESRSAVHSVPSAVGEPSVVLFEPLCPLTLPPPPPPPPAALSLAPLHSAAANFKSFHKARPSSASLSSAAAPPRSVPSATAPRPHSASVRVVVADSGDGCSSEAEVAAVRQSEQLERLTAQLDGGSIGHGQRVPVTGKRKR